MNLAEIVGRFEQGWISTHPNLKFTDNLCEVDLSEAPLNPVKYEYDWDFGQLFSNRAVREIQELLKDSYWRIPTEDDYESLFSVIGLDNSAKTIRDKDGFDMKLAGYGTERQSIVDEGNRGVLWCTSNDGKVLKTYSVGKNDTGEIKEPVEQDDESLLYASIRLVRDVE